MIQQVTTVWTVTGNTLLKLGWKTIITVGVGLWTSPIGTLMRNFMFVNIFCINTIYFVSPIDAQSHIMTIALVTHSRESKFIPWMYHENNNNVHYMWQEFETKIRFGTKILT